jgi:hypothetical protein
LWLYFLERLFYRWTYKCKFDTFVDLPRSQLRKMQLNTHPLAGIEPATLRFRCSKFGYWLRVQKRCIKIIFPGVSYEEGLKLAKLETLCDRRSEACKKLFLQAYSDTSHKLHNLIPKENSCQYSLRRSRKLLVPRTRTDRFKNSFVISNSSNM